MAASNARATEIGLTVTRIVLGVVFVMHGWQKYDETTIDGVRSMFEGMGIPFAHAAAIGVTLVEVFGGVALVLGALVRLVAGLFVLTMAGALWFAHWEYGFFASDGGYEYVLVLGVLSGLFVAVGGGRYSVDGWLDRGGSRASSLV